MLGFTPFGRIADGEISISRELAEEAVRRIAKPLGLSLIDAAKGVHRLANAQMMRALRAVSSERGRDPREFALIAYGGAGPIHAAGLAAQLDIRTVLIPPLAGFFSAVGLLFARHEFHDVRTCQLDPREQPRRARRLFEAMRSSIERQLPRENDYIWVRSTDVRYRGQSWEIEVSIPSSSIRDSSLEELIERFEAEHELLYGFRHEPGSSVEVRAARLAAIGPPPQHNVGLGAPITAAPPEATRQAHFDAGESETPVLNRASVGPDHAAGPLLIDEYDTTVVVPPDWQVRLDSTTNALILERGSGGG